MIDIVPADNDGRISAARALFLEYAGSLEVDLCFQDFEAEMARFPADYAAPDGALLLAVQAGHPVGVVGLRPLSEGCCEMKRLYVVPSARASGAGRELARAIIRTGKQLGYRAMRLDTLTDLMQPAIALYRSLGFEEIAAYNDYGDQAPGALMFLEYRYPRD